MTSGEPRLWSAYRELAEGTVRTDLTHTSRSGQPRFAGFGDEHRKTLFDRERGDGLTAHRCTLAGQWGTHVDPPAHFVAGARTLDLIPVEEMILPLAVLDITARGEADPDTTPTLDDVRAWERRNGRFPPGAFVALRTGWSCRWPDPVAMANRDREGTSRTPGWSAEVLTYLYHLAHDHGHRRQRPHPPHPPPHTARPHPTAGTPHSRPNTSAARTGPACSCGFRLDRPPPDRRRTCLHRPADRGTHRRPRASRRPRDQARN
ncbi:cyclase family protein [Streptomyces sp. NPDC101224]|uniref:cyclase family protein n=1 Tax=Streptomyces sp. NPDC101224 TaxID=3366134 RepID=UPI0037FADDDD